MARLGPAERMADFAALRDELRRADHMLMRERANDERDQPRRLAADYLVLSMGFLPPGDHWAEVQPSEAREIIYRALRYDMAYGTEREPDEIARVASRRFVVAFAEDATFFSNGSEFHSQALRSSAFLGGFGLTPATFNTGIVAVDDYHVGILWVDDED